jgi:hypothetical protein
MIDAALDVGKRNLAVLLQWRHGLREAGGAKGNDENGQ